MTAPILVDGRTVTRNFFILSQLSLRFDLCRPTKGTFTFDNKWLLSCPVCNFNAIMPEIL
jgi:hypothetical protein